MLLLPTSTSITSPGILELLQEDTPEGLVIDDFWFNGYKHLLAPEGILGPKQGERLSIWIEHHRFPQNKAFNGESVVLPDDGSLPEITLFGGMKLTLLSPNRDRLVRLLSEWKKIIEDMNLPPGEAGTELAELIGHPIEKPLGVLGDIDVEILGNLSFENDASRPNGSSIAFLAEFEGKRVLFTGDCFADDLQETIPKLLGPADKLPLNIDFLKLSHHGGKKNTSKELLELVNCDNYLISTDGSYYHHPNQETISRILLLRDEPTHFYFNYRSEENEVWDNESLKKEWNYQTTFPLEGSEGIFIEVNI